MFAAQVIRVERTATSVRAHLLPLETFRGPSGILSIDTGEGESDCGYAFKPGESYLIYADAGGGRFWTGICSRTRPLSQATEDLDYLRTTARTPSNLGLLQGTAWRLDRNYSGQSERIPFPGILITVRGPGVQEAIRTDAGGRYELQVPPGKYEVHVEPPPGLYANALFREVELQSARGCAEADMVLASDGRIRGRVVDTRGQPVAGLPVDLVAPVQDTFTRVGIAVATAVDGGYEFTRVPPGTFHVAFDTLREDSSRRGRTLRVFGPGTADVAAAEAIRLGPSERVNAAVFVLPETAGATRMAGQVRMADGQPVEGARVHLNVAPPTFIYFSGPPAISDRNGEFAMIIPGDAVYEVTVELQNDPERARGMKQIVRPFTGNRWIDIVIPAGK